MLDTIKAFFFCKEKLVEIITAIAGYCTITNKVEKAPQRFTVQGCDANEAQ